MYSLSLSLSLSLSSKSTDSTNRQLVKPKKGMLFRSVKVIQIRLQQRDYKLKDREYLGNIQLKKHKYDLKVHKCKQSFFINT